MNLIAADKITNPWLPEGLRSLSGSDFVSKLISVAVTLGFIAGAIIFVFMLLTGGVSWISSGGDKAAVEAAQKKVTNAAIGLLLLFSLFVILQVIQTIFGINILLLDLPSLNE